MSIVISKPPAHSAFRSTQDQINVQATGLTPAKPGTSRHEGGFALDFQLYKNNSGKDADIISKTNMKDEDDNAFVKKSKELGFRWGGGF
jgi:LAS superfamily LD-carboxypeptidase LdcB